MQKANLYWFGLGLVNLDFGSTFGWACFKCWIRYEYWLFSLF